MSLVCYFIDASYLFLSRNYSKSVIGGLVYFYLWFKYFIVYLQENACECSNFTIGMHDFTMLLLWNYMFIQNVMKIESVCTQKS